MSIDMIIKANNDPEGLKRELMRYKKKDLIDFTIWIGQSISKFESLNAGEFQIIQWALEYYKRYLKERWVDDSFYEKILDKVKKKVKS